MAEWTTEDVRAAAIYGPTRDSLDYPEKEVRERLRGEGFDRWLAAHDAEVRAKALEDAADAYEALPEGERTYFPGIHAGWLRARAERGEA